MPKPAPMRSHVSRVVVLPGFGDPLVGEAWVDQLADACGPQIETVALDWPGLWTRGAEPVSVHQLVRDVVALAEPTTALVGHSLGGLLALQIAARHPVAAAVGVCSPTAWSELAPEAVGRWRQAGTRPTVRQSPNGVTVTIKLPRVFVDELAEALDDVAIPKCPTLLVFGSSDTVAPFMHWSQVPQAGERPSRIIVDGCPHRFMDDPASCQIVTGTVAAFLTRSS